ncbi:MAG: two-component sensor histidine kinase [Deltaproteobacteria bacterium]|nr:MAG: two-component sensor histidine kinase [Deltaproteobacteria bacterium]
MESRTRELLDEHMRENYRKTSRVFSILLAAQWVFGILLAVVISPRSWAGLASATHVHIYAAVFLGGAITSLPLYLTLTRPESLATRLIVGVAQMLWSALLIHLTGGRIETHFHVFGSLAFLAFYRDWKVLLVATVVVASDHLLRGIFWPESVYGIADPAWWRFLEHAAWVVFEDVVLVFACFRGIDEMRSIARQRTELEKTFAELERTHQIVTRTEKLAAVGQLAASVGHELRNPLTAIRNAHAYISKRVLKSNAASDARTVQFLGLQEREIHACNRIISDLLDFARERPLDLRPCPLRPLIEEAFSVVTARDGVDLVNEVPADLPVPALDKDQFRQVLVNLVQNAVEAMPAGRAGTVRVSAAGSAGDRWRIAVIDDGAGIAPELHARIFEPLFTTKSKGTGLGLAVVATMLKRHGCSISVKSEIGRGTEFAIEIPLQTPSAAAA